MRLFSVIVPVYKTEKYLEQCVKSVLEQTYKDFELILVDDGSPDKCPQICDEFARADERVLTIHKRNGGLSSARNAGVLRARGDYILFLDSDDYWGDIQALETIRAELSEKKRDVLLFGCTDYYMDSNTLHISRNDYKVDLLQESSIHESVQYLVESGLFPGAAWILAVKREVLVQNNISFEEGIFAEDIDWLLNVFSHIDSCGAINNPFYIYRKNRKGSITNNGSLKSVTDVLYSVGKWKLKLQENQFDSVRNSLMGMLSYYYFTALIISGRLDKNQFCEIKMKLCQYSGLLKYGVQKKIKIANILYKLLGIRLTGIILSKTYDLRGKMS